MAILDFELPCILGINTFTGNRHQYELLIYVLLIHAVLFTAANKHINLNNNINQGAKGVVWNNAPPPQLSFFIYVEWHIGLFPWSNISYVPPNQPR